MDEMSLVTAERNSGAGSMPELHANGKSLDIAPRRLGRLTPTAADTPMKLLRDRFREHGYLWLKGFLDPAEVTAFRTYVFTAYGQGWPDRTWQRPGAWALVGRDAAQGPGRQQADGAGPLGCLRGLLRPAQAMDIHGRVPRRPFLPAQAQDHALHAAAHRDCHSGSLRSDLSPGRHQPHRDGVDSDRRRASPNGRPRLPLRLRTRPAPRWRPSSPARPWS